MTGPPVITRQYRAGDAVPTLAVFRRAVDITAGQDYSAEQRSAWAPADLTLTRWARERAASRTWVAVVGGRVVGFTDLSLDGHIGMLYVSPDLARRGVATQLLTLVLATAEAESLTELTVDASRTARPFFQRQGFSTVAEQQVERRGVLLTNYRMRLALRPRTATRTPTPA